MARGKAQTTALATWDAELAKQAEEYADQEAGVGGGSKFSIRGGTLSFNDAPLPNNEMAVVICDSILENVYYEGDFDPDSLSSPSCFAFGRDDKQIAPHADVEEPKAEKCDGCPMNEWGSSSKGRGKACRNRRRLALVSAGNFDADGNFEPFESSEDFSKAQIGYFGIPPTSLKGYAAYVTQLKTNLKRPPFAVFTRVSVVPDPKTQVKIQFELLGPAPDDIVQVLIDKNKEARALIEFPYQKQAEQAAPAPKRAPRAAPARAPRQAPVSVKAAPRAAPVARAPAAAPKRTQKF